MGFKFVKLVLQVSHVKSLTLYGRWEGTYRCYRSPACCKRMRLKQPAKQQHFPPYSLFQRTVGVRFYSGDLPWKLVAPIRQQPIVSTRLAVHKQSFLNLWSQNGRRLTKICPIGHFWVPKNLTFKTRLRKWDFLELGNGRLGKPFHRPLQLLLEYSSTFSH